MSNVITEQVLLVCLDSAREDFMIYLYEDSMRKAKKIVDKAIDEWFDDEDKAGDTTMSEYVSMKLKENDFRHDIYYNPEAYEEEMED